MQAKADRAMSEPVSSASAERPAPAVRIAIEPARAGLYTALAEEMRDVRKLVEEIAEVLVSDERFIHDYIEMLQKFDLIIQRTDEGADLLDRLAGGHLAHDAIEKVRLTSVQARLQAAIRHS